MSRYGWSSGEPISPFNSSLGGGGVPDVTDEDFSYITSEDLEEHGNGEQRRGHTATYRRERGDTVSRTARPAPRGVPEEDLEDDILLIRDKRGVTFPEHFPAFSIGDGKLLVSDLRDRVKLAMKLSDREARRAQILYKGRHLNDASVPICEYGVKNNSEVLVEAGEPDSSGESSEEIVVVEHDGGDGRKRRQKKKRGRKGDRERNGDRSPPDSGSNVGSTVGLDVPRAKKDRRGGSTSRAQSPSSAVSASSAAPGGPMEKLNSIGSHFTTKLLPLCVQFTARPPVDSKRREEEHRKLSETVMQQVILKLDEVDTAGDEEARNRRRELVRQVQEVLKGLDGRLRE